MNIDIEIQLSGDAWAILASYWLKSDFDFEALARIGNAAKALALSTVYRGPVRFVEDGEVVFEVDSPAKLLDGVQLKSNKCLRMQI